MNEFVRGARVRKPPETYQAGDLTLNEASFVVCMIADKDGLTELRPFLEHMARAWKAYVLARQPSQTGDKS